MSLRLVLTGFERYSVTSVEYCICQFNYSSGQNGHHFLDEIFKCIFVTEKFCFSIRISLKFVPKGPADNKPALVLVMAWCQTGDKPLPQPMVTQFTQAYMQQQGEMSKPLWY